MPMHHKSKTRRRKNKVSGKETVAYFNSRNNRVIVTRNAQVNMTGKNANNTVTITPAAPVKEATPIIIRATTSPTTPQPQSPMPKKSRRKTVVALIVAGLSAIGIGYALYKKSA